MSSSRWPRCNSTNTKNGSKAPHTAAAAWRPLCEQSSATAAKRSTHAATRCGPTLGCSSSSCDSGWADQCGGGGSGGSWDEAGRSTARQHTMRQSADANTPHVASAVAERAATALALPALPTAAPPPPRPPTGGTAWMRWMSHKGMKEPCGDREDRSGVYK